MTVGLACGAIIASLAIVTQAHAYDAQAWMRFGSHTGHAQDGGRAFARRWEANPPRGFPTLSKKNLAPMKRAIAQYRAIVKKGGWKRVPRIVLRPGANHDAVVALRRRLFASGDLRSTSLSTHYGYYVEKAVRRFQASNGLSPTGVVDKRTISALNVPAKDRLRQLRVNYSRLRELSRSTAKRYVLVNIPAAQVEAIENDKVASRHAGVVGKIDRKTPTLRSRVHELNFNPVWRLPPTVVKKDLIPKGRSMQRRGKSVLVKYGIDAYSGGRKLNPSKVNWLSAQPHQLSYRQQPGKDNPMGFVKINFHNAHAVYLHDTPSASIFRRNFRAASSGCVRVLGIDRLAAWILRDNSDWSLSRVRRMKKTGDSANVRVRRPVPIYMVYLTAWSTPDGVVHFRRDLYRRDGVGRMASAY